MDLNEETEGRLTLVAKNKKNPFLFCLVKVFNDSQIKQTTYLFFFAYYSITKCRRGQGPRVLPHVHVHLQRNFSCAQTTKHALFKDLKGHISMTFRGCLEEALSFKIQLAHRKHDVFPTMKP